MAAVKTKTRLYVGIIGYVILTPVFMACILVEALKSAFADFRYSVKYQFREEYMEGWRRAGRIYRTLTTTPAQKGGE